MTAAAILKSLLPLWEIQWREAASCVFLAIPAIAISADSDTFHAPTLLSLISATLYCLATWNRGGRRFLVPEVLVGLLYPTAAPILVAAWFLALRKWKDAHLARRSQERRRSALLADLGLTPSRVSLPLRWLPPAMFLAWLAEIIGRTWPIAAPKMAILVFAVFASGLVSMLTSAQPQVK